MLKGDKRQRQKRRRSVNIDDPVLKDFVDRAILAERRVTDKQFESRDLALKVLADGASNQKSVHLAIGIAVLSVILSPIVSFLIMRAMR